MLTEVERARFPRTWGVRRAAVVVTPFCHHVFDHDGEVPERDYVFAGGDSLRDYDLLVEAARGLPARVAVATRTPLPAAPKPTVVTDSPGF
ncbi:MAG: hypothetical protein M3P95_06770 [Actinomycetota bacterium]|nr:hypothetical protein [Actinomycetota bacterium]